MNIRTFFLISFVVIIWWNISAYCMSALQLIDSPQYIIEPKLVLMTFFGFFLKYCVHQMIYSDL